MERPVIIIYSLEDARAALAAARSRGAAVTLRSGADMAFYAGAAYFKRLAERARSEFPEVRCRFVLDCGEDPGIALGALRSGIEEIAFRGRPELAAKLADIARRHGARLCRERRGRRGRGGGASRRALDLLDARDPAKACLDWLSEPGAAKRAGRLKKPGPSAIQGAPTPAKGARGQGKRAVRCD